MPVYMVSERTYIVEGVWRIIGIHWSMNLSHVQGKIQFMGGRTWADTSLFIVFEYVKNRWPRTGCGYAIKELGKQGELSFVPAEIAGTQGQCP